MNVAITGGNGDLGGALALRHRPEHHLRCIDVTDVKDVSDINATAQPVDGIDYRQADVCDLAGLTAALRGVDAVVHLAALRNPYMAPAETVFRINALGAYNVTLACEAAGIKHIVFASSICYYGYIFRKDFAAPPYLPVDEDTPPQVEDSYSLSKLAGENIMQAFVQRTSGSAASLRFAYLMRDGARGSASVPAQIADMPVTEQVAKSWWTYVDLDDAAQAVWLALDYISTRLGMCESFNIGADDTHTTTPTAHLVSSLFPHTETRFGDLLESQPHLALFSNQKAREALGFRPSPAAWRQK